MAFAGWLFAVWEAVKARRMTAVLRRMVNAIDAESEDWPSETFIWDWADEASALIDGHVPEEPPVAATGGDA
jgi:hypothetical protein